MATTHTDRSFSAMLNEYLTLDLLREELVKRDYILQTVEKDDSWKQGTLPVPFKANGATSVKFGSLTAVADIKQHQFVRGYVDEYKEVWGSLILNHADLIQHDGRVNEDSFLSNLLSLADDFLNSFKRVVSCAMLAGPHFATAVEDGGADGTIKVDRVDRFEIGQLVSLYDTSTAAADYHVIAIDVNSGVAGYPGSGDITLSATAGGAAADISAYTVADSAQFFHPGVNVAGDNAFASLKDQLLSSANGGSASIFNVTKTDYPYTQAVNIDGSAVSAANILEKIFDAYTEVRAKAKGMATDVLMSWKHFGSIMKLIEIQKGAYKVREGSMSASEYGWTTIEIGSVSGTFLKFVGIQEMDDDVIMFMDWSAVKFYSNGMIRKHKTPDGLEYYVVRNTDGYQYVVDIFLFGELVVFKPGHCAIMHSIPNY